MPPPAHVSGRPLEMRDSAILGRLASSRRSRAPITAVSDAKMTPWGTDVVSESAAEFHTPDNHQSTPVSANGTPTHNNHQQQRPNSASAQTLRASAASHHVYPKDHLFPPAEGEDGGRASYGGYSVPDVSATHNHFQNRETEQRRTRLQMAHSKINESHMSGGVVAMAMMPHSTSRRVQDNLGHLAGDMSVAEDSASVASAASRPAAGMPSGGSAAPAPARPTGCLAPPAGARMEEAAQPRLRQLTSRINDGHNLVFEDRTLAVENRLLRPESAKSGFSVTRPVSPQRDRSGFVKGETSFIFRAPRALEEPFQPAVHRGPVRQPWTGYTDVAFSDKFAGARNRLSNLPM